MNGHGQEQALNRLIVGCEDDARTYDDAARTVSRPEHRQELLVLSRRRREFASALAAQVKSLGGTPPHGGSAQGSLRRGLSTLRTLVGGPNDGDSFNECAHVEARVSQLYLRALEHSWPDDTCSTLCQQLAEVESGTNEMSHFRDAGS